MFFSYWTVLKYNTKCGHKNLVIQLLDVFITENSSGIILWKEKLNIPIKN